MGWGRPQLSNLSALWRSLGPFRQGDALDGAKNIRSPDNQWVRYPSSLFIPKAWSDNVIFLPCAFSVPKANSHKLSDKNMTSLLYALRSEFRMQNSPLENSKTSAISGILARAQISVASRRWNVYCWPCSCFGDGNNQKLLQGISQKTDQGWGKGRNREETDEKKEKHKKSILHPVNLSPMEIHWRSFLKQFQPVLSFWLKSLQYLPAATR